ncbi:hypothetical protein [Actibacterium sp. 188UL27-1]|uniref:hypothetical protein n=1 Tax=Actibacterium sp. 188UL27-1 TaxID=2786961 RepID=UPI00195BCAA3|nr:hypothetical protein [Actibacterium sp. 188UL27-1]MBM7067212.1 hypothetical protein [Actibacterium sp. 188UL27-1]
MSKHDIFMQRAIGISRHEMLAASAAPFATAVCDGIRHVVAGHTATSSHGAVEAIGFDPKRFTKVVRSDPHDCTLPAEQVPASKGRAVLGPGTKQPDFTFF